MTLVWYVRTDEITRMGPFKDQAEAWRAVQSVKTGTPAEGATVWCEEEKPCPGSRTGKPHGHVYYKMPGNRRICHYCDKPC